MNSTLRLGIVATIASALSFSAHPSLSAASSPGSAQLSLHDYGSTAVELSWTAASGMQNASKYQIYNGDNALSSVPTSSTSVLVTDLIPRAHYEFHLGMRQADGTVSAVSDTVDYTVAEVPFRKGVRAGFLGLYSHTEVPISLEEACVNVETLLNTSPILSGVSIKLWWKTLHPEKNVVKWKELDELIAACARKNKLVHIAIFPGMNSPEWIYQEGVKRTAPVEVGGRSESIPVLWDPKYIALYTADIKELGRRYADDPRVDSIQITGHHYKGGEMHAPKADTMGPLIDAGISHDVVLANWKYWIDLFGSVFPHKKLNVVISQMYPARINGEDYSALPDEVVKYFVTHYQGRAVLQTMQLNGRQSELGMSQELCRKYSDYAPNCHEMVGSFLTQAERQGTIEMTIYNFLAQKNPLYLQFWRSDAIDPTFIKRVDDAWKRYGGMELTALKARLQRDGKWQDHSTFSPESLRVEKLKKQQPAAKSGL